MITPPNQPNCIEPNVVTDEFPFTQGGWQGGTCTPDKLNCIIANIYTTAITTWRMNGAGYHMEGYKSNRVIWADNNKLKTNNYDEL